MKNLYKNIKFALGLSLAGAGLTGQTQSKQGLEGKLDGDKVEQITEANRLLREFPSEIPGAKKIEKYETEGARYVFVHLRQAHEVKDMDSKSIERVQKIQDENYDSIIFLKNKYNLPGVFAEGRTLEAYLGDKVQEISAKISDSPLPRREPSKIIKNAARRAHDSKIMEIYPAETMEGNAKGVFGWNHFNFPYYQENNSMKMVLLSMTLDDREDIALKLASEICNSYASPLAVCQFGGKHDFGGYKTKRHVRDVVNRLSFRDNISEWNEKNDSLKFSLIEITPLSYLDYTDDPSKNN